MADRPRHRRLFLALWPDQPTRQRLAEVQKTVGRAARLKTARRVPVANLHITTHFLGDVSEAVHLQLKTLLGEVRGRSCTLVVNRWGYFPKAKVVWLGADTPAALDDLVAQTQASIEACIEDYRQKRFVPHITIYRKARHPLEVEVFDPVEWTIDRFALVESVTHPQGAVYTVLQEWMLG